MIELKSGGHRVYWKSKDKAKEVTEEFPFCEDKGFYALLKIGWYEVGELPVAASEGTAGAKPKRRGKKKKKEEEEEEEDEFVDDEDEDALPVVTLDCLSESESDNEEDLVQHYTVLERPRRGKERFWRRVNTGGIDAADNSRLQVIAVCRGNDDGLIYFKYYDVHRYVAGPPKKSEEYDYTVCEEMDPPTETEDCWMRWDPLPDTSCSDPAAGGATIGRPPSRWKGYVVLTPEEEEEQRAIEEAKTATEALASDQRTRSRRN